MKLRTDPARVRLVLAYLEGHGFRETCRKFDLSSRSLDRWVKARADLGPDWPTLDLDRHFLATKEARDHRAGNLRTWRTRYYLNRGPLLVDSIGTTRRIRALMAIGWNAAAIAEQGPWDTGDALLELAKRARIHVDNRDRVAAIYDLMCMTPGPSVQTRARALCKGWAPPLSWDENIDDPAATPYTDKVRDDEIDDVVVDRLIAGDRVPSTNAEKVEAMRQWTGQGRPESALCTFHGWKPGRYVVRQDGAA